MTILHRLSDGDANGLIGLDLAICRSGHGDDGKGLTPLLIRHLAETTNWIGQACGYRTPCRVDLGPEDVTDADDQGHLGELDRLWVEPDPADSAVLILHARCFLPVDVVAWVISGDLPMRSITIAQGGTDPYGRATGPFVSYLVLRGRSPANFPDLWTARSGLHSTTHQEPTMTTLILQRLSDDGHSTLGALYVDGNFACFTLEDTHRDVKIHGQTRIPAGDYPLALQTTGTMHPEYLHRFPAIHKGMLHVAGIPGYEGVHIHIGNVDGDTAGCILVGDQATSNQSADTDEGRVLASTAAYVRIYPRIAAAIAAGSVRLEVRDEAAMAGVHGRKA